MRYKINKRKLPRNKNDISNMRCILKAISEHFLVTSDLLEVSYSKFRGYLNSLEKKEIIVRVGKCYCVEDYNINDNEKYEKFLRNNKKLLFEMNLKVIKVRVEL